MRYLLLCTYRFLPLWFNWGVYAAYGRSAGMFDYLMGTQQLALLVLALIGLWSAPKRGWLLAFCVAVFCLAHMAIIARLRYVIPVMPVVILFAAIAIDRFWSWIVRVTDRPCRQWVVETALRYPSVVVGGIAGGSVG
jgi:hypothetical protein